MELRDPVVGYKPASQREAQLVLIALADAGIDASIIEDTSQVGLWSDDRDALQSRPQIWIERDDVARAALALHEYERRVAELRDPERESAPIEVTCESCGQQSSFPGECRGSVENCPHCHAYVDVGVTEGIPWWDVGSDDPPGEEE
jgi:hypothetical protein